MEVKFPTGISQFKLYSLAEKALKSYTIDSTNLYEFPIRVFNKLANSMGYEVTQELHTELNRVFTEKGSTNSVINLLHLIGIDANVSSELGNELTVNIRIDTVNKTDFLEFLSDSVSYLIFYETLMVYIESLTTEITFIKSYELSAIGLDVVFRGI